MKQNNYNLKPIYVFNPNKPMHIAAFVSGGGGNLQAELDVQKQFPNLVSVDLVIADRLGTVAIEIAKKNGIMYIEKDFEAKCGVWRDVKGDKKASQKYIESSIQFHNEILEEIIEFEERFNEIDLAVLSYRRWIHGKLLDYFKDRMINQHAGDLTIFNNEGSRKYIGINPVYDALKKGERYTRTSTFLVNDGHDAGEILSQGPKVFFYGKEINKEIAYKHELKQKEFSDWPSIKFAIKEISLGNYSIAKNMFHRDGSRILFYKNEMLPYGGIELD